MRSPWRSKGNGSLDPSKVGRLMCSKERQPYAQRVHQAMGRRTVFLLLIPVGQDSCALASNCQLWQNDSQKLIGLSAHQTRLTNSRGWTQQNVPVWHCLCFGLGCLPSCDHWT